LAQNRFIERTLVDINQTLEQSVFAEKISRQHGLLQRLDPRAKLIFTLLLLIGVGSARQFWMIAAFFVITLVLVVLSKIPLGSFLWRICMLVLFFTSLIAIPALFMTHGPALWTLSGRVIVTRTGALSAACLISRVTTSVSLATLFILTTPWNDVLKALGLLRLPDVIVLILAMTYRYIHLLLHEAADMFMAQKSRILRPLTHAESHELLGATGGVLLSKSLQLSGEVYLAMQSRGYHHYPRTLNEFQMHVWDYAAVTLSFLLMLAVFLVR
jgi:cobalt/nickel transport system permease protein